MSHQTGNVMSSILTKDYFQLMGDTWTPVDQNKLLGPLQPRKHANILPLVKAESAQLTQISHIFRMMWQRYT